MQLFVNNGLLWKYLRQAKKKKMQLSKGGKKHNSSGLTQTVSAASNLSGLTEASNLHLFAHKSRTSKRCIWAVQQMAVVWARTPIKSRSDATGKVTETQMYNYDVAQLRLRPCQAALTESFNNCQGRSKVAENNNDPKTEQIPSKPLHSRQDVHLVTSVTTADCQGSSAHAAISVHLHTLH